MDLQNSKIHEIDTRENTTFTVFDGSREEESKLAKQFWNSITLIPPVESTLVCKEIKQRTRTRTVDEGTKKPRFSTATEKNKKEKSIKDTIYDETAAFQFEQEEAQRIRINERRHQQVRQLFYKQAKANRTKSEQWSVPQFQSYLNNIHHEGMTMTFENDIDEGKYQEDERQLVCSLPD